MELQFVPYNSMIKTDSLKIPSDSPFEGINREFRVIFPIFSLFDPLSGKNQGMPILEVINLSDGYTKIRECPFLK